MQINCLEKMVLSSFAVAAIPTAYAVPFLEALSYFTLRDRSVMPRTTPFCQHIFLPHSKIKLVLDGDFIQTSAGKKKLKKIFNEFKVSTYEKSSKWGIACGSEVIWVQP